MATTGDRPRFRQDLIAEAIEADTGDVRFIDVMDPDNGTLFRFFESEYSLACGMDGQRDIAGLVRWAEEELGLKPSQNEVRSVIATLGDLGFIEGGAAAAAAVAAAAHAEPPARNTPPPTPSPAVSRAPTPQPPPRHTPQPAAAKADDYLGKGVVAASKPQPHAPAADVELGHAGTSRAAKGADLPRAPELELGAPGTASQGARAAAPRGEDIALGAPGGRADMDLAADMPIRPDDVKEAVRQSQVMKAAEVPPEVRAEFEPPRSAKAEPARPAEAPRAEPPRAEPPREAKPEPRPAPAPRAEPRAPIPAPEPARGISPVLLAALVLAILAGGGLLLWKFVLNKKSEKTDVSTAPTPTTPTPPKPDQPPPPPAVETVKLAAEQPTPAELKAPAAGTLQAIVANDTVVKEGDAVAKLAGYKTPEQQVTATQKALTKAKADLEATQKDHDAAQAGNNKNAATAAEKKIAVLQKQIADQETKLQTEQAALDKLIIKAPSAGKVTAVAKTNAKVTPSDVVATIASEPMLAATFKNAGAVPVGAHVLVALKSGQKLSCKVTQADGGVKVGCPKDAAPEGSEVTFAGVDPSAPPEPPKETPAETPTDAPKGDAPKGDAPKVDAAPKEKAPAKRPRPHPPQGSGASEKPTEKPVEKPAGGGGSAEAPAGSGT